MSARRVLITGTSGFVGANVARGMLRRGHEVHCLVRADYRPWRLEEIAGDVRLHVADMLDRAGIGALFDSVRPHWVLHLAAYGAYETQADVTRCVRTNVEASVNMLDAAAERGVERFVNTGSSSEYGFKDHPPDESEQLEPNSLYAVTKAAATAYAQHLGRSGKLSATTLRLYSVYGPYEEPTRLIPTVVLRGLGGAYPPLVSPDTARDFVYVDDVVAAYDAVLHADVPPGAVYNVGTGTQTTLRDVVAASRAYFGIGAEPGWGTMAQRKWDTRTWIANTGRIASEVGWRASTPFEAGFGRTAAWMSEPARRAFYESHRRPPE
ncbi:MAG TPA: NAD-dependent epimerase/dehydratase family protein [Candidatus Sulfotelmatobacter sp.]|nr:NAD-dependent epimerase/dehydratase family protein [Candidatus Sulfotelmatobacter sp.]